MGRPPTGETLANFFRRCFGFVLFFLAALHLFDDLQVKNADLYRKKMHVFLVTKSQQKHIKSHSQIHHANDCLFHWLRELKRDFLTALQFAIPSTTPTIACGEVSSLEGLQPLLIHAE